MIAWLGFFSGAAQMYLLAESGDRIFHANFLWGAQIMAFLLFCASVRWYFQKRLTHGIRTSVRSIPILLIYTLHLVFGIAYYVRSFLVETYW